jgi:hypothetical protein
MPCTKTFEADFDEALGIAGVPEDALIRLEDFRSGRRFSSVENLDPKFEHALEGSKIEGTCVIYPGDQFLGFDADSGIAWFEDYKGVIRGDLDAVEERLYLWAIAEDTDSMLVG